MGLEPMVLAADEQASASPCGHGGEGNKCGVGREESEYEPSRKPSLL